MTMRRFLAFTLFLAALFLSGCKKEPSLSLSGPASLELSAGGGSSSASFTVNRDWTASTSDSWVSVSPSSGTASDGPVMVTVTASPNTTYEDRTATVTIRAEGLSQSITVRQPANLGVVIPTKSFEIASDARTVEVAVQSNVDYTVSVSAGWIKQTGTKALTSKTLVFSVEENTSYDPRSATITVKPQSGGEAEQVISVKQAQKDALQVSKATYGMPYGGGEIDVKVEANVAFEVKSGVDWIQYVNTKGLSSSTVVLRVAGNATYESREGKVTIQQKNGSLSISITVKQDGRVAVTGVTLDKSNLSLQPGETATLTATVKPDNATDKSVTWSSSDEKVATVSSDGTVTAVAVGTATITAQAGNKTATCKVTVSDKEQEIKTALMKIYDAMDGPNWKITRKWDLSKPLVEWEGVGWDEVAERLMLDFRGFGLKGKFPDCFGELTPLYSFYCQEEPGVTGTLPPSFKSLKNLDHIALAFTSMTSLPDLFQDMPLKFAFITGNASMTGPLPESLGSSPVLEELSFGQNAFTGKVPDSWARLGTGLQLQEGSLDERVPDSFVQSADAYYLVNMYITLTNWRTAPVVVGDYDIPAFWPRKDIKDVVTGATIDFKKIISQNKVTVLLNWATWCPFSKDLMPVLKKMYEKYHKDGLEIISAFNSDSRTDDQGKPLKDVILERGYDKWYNFNLWDFTGTEWNIWCAGTPSAVLVDNTGMTLASSKTNVSDPARNRFGYPASTQLIPLLEDIFGPLDDDDDYSSTDYSKDGEVVKLQSASTGKGINVVFMGDGYTDRDVAGGLYLRLMEYSMEEFFAIEPYKSFRDRFNVYAVTAVSKNGKTGPGYSTALGTSATISSISTGNIDKCYEYALKVPGIQDDKNLLIGVLVNSSTSARGITVMSESKQSGVAYYGSTGNDRGAFGNTIRHEAGGHGFAFLDDEYETVQGTATAEHIDNRNAMYKKYGWYSNVDFTNDPSKVKWSAFLNDQRYQGEVGIYEGGSLYSKGAYRPSENSMMRDNYEFYNAPSRWAIYQRIMKLSGEECTFEGFLQYDAVNRGKKQTAVRPPLRMQSVREPDAPPVVIP